MHSVAQWGLYVKGVSKGPGSGLQGNEGVGVEPSVLGGGP